MAQPPVAAEQYAAAPVRFRALRVVDLAAAAAAVTEPYRYQVLVRSRVVVPGGLVPLSPLARFGARFGMTDAGVAVVTGWLTAGGFTIDEVAKSRGWINFSGVVKQVEQAFATEIHDYRDSGTVRHANTLEPSIPRGLTGMVRGIVSLHNFPRPSHLRRHGPAVLMAPLDDISGSNLLAPPISPPSTISPRPTRLATTVPGSPSPSWPHRPQAVRRPHLPPHLRAPRQRPGLRSQRPGLPDLPPDARLLYLGGTTWTIAHRVPRPSPR